MSLSAPSPRWILRPVDELAVSRVRASTGTSLSPLVQRLLAQRDPGSGDAVQRFLQPKLVAKTRHDVAVPIGGVEHLAGCGEPAVRSTYDLQTLRKAPAAGRG